MSDDQQSPDLNPAISQAEAEQLAAEGDGTMQRMLRHGPPYDRDTYLAMGGFVPDPHEGWTAEQEMQLPEQFQVDMSLLPDTTPGRDPDEDDEPTAAA